VYIRPTTYATIYKLLLIFSDRTYSPFLMIVTIFSERSYSVTAVGQAGAGLDWWVRETAAALPEPTTPSSPRKPWGSRPTGASACRGSRWMAYSMVPDAKQVTSRCRHRHVPPRDLCLRETGPPRLPSAPQRHLPSNLPPDAKQVNPRCRRRLHPSSWFFLMTATTSSCCCISNLLLPVSSLSPSINTFSFYHVE
jgi:hypothetical protein